MKPTRKRRRDRLRERADVDDVAGLAHGVERGRTLAAPDQVGIAIVLEDRHAVVFGQLAAARSRRSIGMMVPVGFCTVGIV